MTTKQEFFTKTIEMLKAQGGPAWDALENTCKYRAGDRACAIGLWIPQDEYDAEPQEAISANEAVESDYWPTITKLAETVTTELMCNIQYAHDMAADSDKSDADWLRDFMIRCTIIADKHNLKMETVI